MKFILIQINDLQLKASFRIINKIRKGQKTDNIKEGLKSSVIQMKMKAMAKIFFVSLFQEFERKNIKFSFHLNTAGIQTRIRKERLWRTAAEQVENITFLKS